MNRMFLWITTCCGLAAVPLVAPGWDTLLHEDGTAAEVAAAPSSEKREASAAGRSDAVPLIPRPVLFGNPSRRAGPQLSPDGTRRSYLAPEY